MSADQVIDGLLMLLPAAAQACVAWQDRGRTGRVPHPGVLLGLSWALAALPQDVHLGSARIAAYVLGDALFAIGFAGYVHLARRQALPEPPPGRWWLVAN